MRHFLDEIEDRAIIFFLNKGWGRCASTVNHNEASFSIGISLNFLKSMFTEVKSSPSYPSGSGITKTKAHQSKS